MALIGRPPVSLRKRFDDKWVPEPNSGCWLWLAATRRHGYGIISLADGSNAIAHRVAWELYRGPIPVGLWALHRCDVPSCVNPAHLFLGTPTDNVTDMFAKGRARPPRGIGHWCARLTESDVLSIRAATSTYQVLSEAYGVSNSVISNIRNRKAWRHI